MSNKQQTRLSQLMSDLKTFSKSGNAREALEAQNIPGSEKNKPQEIPDPASLGLASKETEAVPAGSTPTGESTASSATDQARPGEQPLVAGSSAEVTPETKPLTKSDLDKKASDTAKIANELTARILAHNQATQKQAAVAPKAVVTKPAVTPVEDKSAHAPFDLQLTNDVLAKIAAVVCSTADGAAFCEQKVAEFIGAQEAQEWIGFLAQQNQVAEKQAAADQAEYEAGVKYAEELITLAQNPFFKQGQAIGMESLSTDAPPDAGTPEDGAPADVEGDDGEEITPEDIVGALEMLVQNGEIAPETAAGLLEDLMGGGEGGDPAAGAVVDPAAGAEAPVESEPPAPASEEEKKEAAAKLGEELRAHFAKVANK